MKNNKKLILLLLTAILLLCGCSYKKPETLSMLGLNIQSITTVCGTDCTLDKIDTSSTDEHGTATYVYTDVAGDQGITDAKTYHEYLKGIDNCIKIDDFDESNDNYTAYFTVDGYDIEEGFSMKVTYTADSYTVCINDNVNLEDLD